MVVGAGFSRLGGRRRPSCRAAAAGARHPTAQACAAGTPGAPEIGFRSLSCRPRGE
jgi:hypothetical protein